jgi:hypothetical protein
LPFLGAFGGMVLVRQARKNGSNRGIFHFSFLLCHDVRSRKAVKSAFWNLAVSGKVSRSAEFGLVWAYSVGTTGVPKRADQGFRCKKSSQ